MKKQEVLKQSKKVVDAVRMEHVTKTFMNGSIIANDDISFNVKQNEIHAIVGENGAGKSTLMSILFGVIKPDSGKIYVNNELVNFKSANDANEKGLGMVHQHFKLVDVYTLLENIILGAETTKYGFLDKKSARQKIMEICDKYKLPINLDQLVSKASVGEQQRVEILKLLYRNSNILIFDEPTAVLSDDEIDGFLKMLLEFKKLGKTIIIITHKLNEVKAVADRATVIRLGKVIKTFDMKKVSIKQLSECMVGKQMNAITKKPIVKSSSKTVLEIHDLVVCKQSNTKLRALNHINLNFKAGEIIGIAGIEGNGQSELALALTGIMKPYSGTMKYYYDPKNRAKTVLLESKSIKEIYLYGISHIPEDRHKYGVILDDTVAMNAVLQDIDRKPFSSHGFINFNIISKYTNYLCEQFDVRGAHRGHALMRGLSGGNQQKFVVARELTRPHRIIIAVQPTRGLDLGASNFIHQKMIEDAKKGATVILISYELDEIFEVADRIVVMDSGKIVHDVLTKKTTRSKIGSYLSRTASDHARS